MTKGKKGGLGKEVDSRDFFCVARYESGERESFYVKNVKSIKEAQEELEFQVRGLTSVLWLVNE
ncbi:MAG: hypothetical protein RIR18_1454 [Pseudomonadota bacterium]|jgi:hypothetical protein